MRHLGASDDIELVARAIEQPDLRHVLALTPETDPNLFAHISPRSRAKILSLRGEDGLGGEFYDEMLNGKDNIYWGLFAAGALIGFTGYFDLENPRGPESLTMIINPNVRGQRFGFRAGLMRTYYALVEEQRERARASVALTNVGSANVVRKLGYVCLGHKKEEKYGNEERHLLTVFSPAINDPSQLDNRMPVHDFDTWDTQREYVFKVLEKAKQEIKRPVAA